MSMIDAVKDRLPNRRQDEWGGLPPTVAALARNAAANSASKPQFLHPDPEGELFKRAERMKLGEAKTNQDSIVFDGKTYCVQGFAGGILVAEEGHWNAVAQIPWGTTEDAIGGHKTVSEDQILGGEVATGSEVVGGNVDEPRRIA
jgi:hypothetical protein